MDIKREGVVRKKRIRAAIITGVVLAGIAAISFGLSRLEPAAPSVNRATVWTDVVERGEMIRQVRGPGTLVVVPEAIRWVAARTRGRVDRRVLLPGTEVKTDTVILELSNPELEQELRDAEFQLRAQEAELADLRVRLESQLLNQRAGAATVASEYNQARLQAEADERLFAEKLIGELIQKRSRVRADELETRNELEQQRLQIASASVEAQLAAKRATVEQFRALYELRRSQREALTVRAGIEGVLQELAVEVGQEVTPGANLARVAQPDKLKAQLRIAETQARDIEVDQKAIIDTRNGLIEGRVMRIDPAVREGTVTVDVQLVGELPKGARPDLSVDGTIELERLADVLYVGRPAYGQAESTIGLFKLLDDGETAVRTQVRLGRSSVNTIEVIGGLTEGDEVILSDTSAWDAYDRIRLN
ncbi:MAG TPA: efflux RND transporter periplasmic adaptor subunit [Vicinamibacteria bacterium]|nr:efflux RND transporter periplasmic adaptor subunit [Vicinamibacteria bacterium]